MPYTDQDGNRVEKGENVVTERSFDAAVDANGELVVSVPELLNVEQVLGVYLSSAAGNAVDPSAQYDDTVATPVAVDATEDETEVNASGLAGNEVVVSALNLGDGANAPSTLADGTNIQGTVVVEGE